MAKRKAAKKRTVKKSPARKKVAPGDMARL